MLDKEGYNLYLQGSAVKGISCLSDYDDENMLEAWLCCARAGLIIAMPEKEFHEREARLKKEFEKNVTAPSGENTDLHEAAKEFSDSLLDEQAKKIKQLQEHIVSQNDIISKQSSKISYLNEKITKQNKVITKKSCIIKDKDAVLADVAEELRLSKVREDNLIEVCQKYLKEIDGLKNKLHDLQQKHFELMDERDQTVCELKAEIRNLKKPTEDDVMEGCKEMLRLHIKLMRDFFDE